MRRNLRSSGLSLLVSALFICSVASKNVAIIGAGIGGGSTAYYLSKYAPRNSNPDIYIFEKENRIGGRMKHVTIGGEVCEVGADAWSSVNTYLMELYKELKIPLDNSGYDGNGEIGFYEGNGKWVTNERDLVSEAHLYLQIELFRYRLSRNYEERDKNNTAFKTIEDFVKYGNLIDYTSINMQDFGANHDVKQEFLWGEIVPVIRGIYDQNLDVSAFAGIVSILPGVTDAYAVEGGNSKLVEALVNKSSAHIKLNTTITSITKVANGYQLSTTKENITQVFDSVVIANPFEFSGIKFVGVTPPPVAKRAYQHWFVTLTLAKSVNPAYFGNIAKMPDNIMTTYNSTAPFVVLYPVAQAKSGLIVYKTFSNEDIQHLLNDIYIGVQDHFVQVWPFTFPDLSPQSAYQPIIWAPNLYYISGMDSVATAMECSTIAGRNAALLIAHQP